MAVCTQHQWFYRVMEMHRLSTHTSTAAVQKMLAKYFCNFRNLWLLLNRNHVLKIWAKDMNAFFFLTALPSKTFMCPMVHIIQQLPSFSLPQYIFFSVMQQPSLRIDCPFIELSRSHTIRIIHLVGCLWTSDQLVAETSAYTTYNKQSRPWHRRDSNLQSQQPSGFRPTPQTTRPPGLVSQYIAAKILNYI